ncbi:50S ribosomal protein L29 [Candidatus Woesebacteria bacterium RIFCSPHIGHO2_01_FULL_39_32]|uniref:Large ribosomal subunit protein uL29 n=2 Tax=Candidatus Woeseibacteriota TaxID=1752722 RepID=A0A0G0SXH1_9BACT|nr:MAG: 50S ribosomal protein L29P [Candidatus Woesebacteria bacterium GW2011_GWA1_39_8]OGM04926.1 MAG: 50S ribosomal protein L29 [Candidatus Woesebacteria bacterium GWB1_37_5]OGM24729.1 MAG: 50S ribosomal protein L29 [Candidatus Woesebacteria bacterium RIFCSPHIGHO2_01_FULL_39_32]OGM38185.1 MAG: 50S ribosomal protein L29 [Candidatus Woesebacteria bacterium RIFCSPHIGHO2_12_FULL_38_11]OGM64555.1 MAG: 50S ribosomal protein L29 [Candidatus Woesebacteria bacterium RIFCSPLOWO2_01_FULL_39_25]
MKKKDIISLRSKEAIELAKLVGQMRLEIVKTKANISASKEKNLKKVKNLRHDLAQVVTLMREKQIMEKAKGEIKEEIK